jgi:HlyD family secretion protein
MSNDDIPEPGQPKDTHKDPLEELMGRHEKLRRAYLEVESECNKVVADLKKAHRIRILATLFIIIVFVVIGLYVWKKIPFIEKHLEKKSSVGTFTVQSGPISETISLAGDLKPGEVVSIVAPFDGVVKEKRFQYGEYVTKDQLLLALDVSDMQIKYDGAKTDYIKAADKLKNYQNWENSDDVVKAKRSLSRSKMTLDAQKKTFQATEGLFKEGIVSETEYENAKQQYASAQLDYENAVDELRSTKAKGTGDHLTVATLEMRTARSKLQELEGQLSRAKVLAPVAGVIVLPSSEDKDKKGKRVEKGVSFTRGEVVVTIGNIEKLSVQVDVDEIEVMKVKTGQDVTVTGDAFPRITLTGKVASISSQGTRGDGQKGPPSFGVNVLLDALPREVMERIRLKGIPEPVMEKIRLGMSADVKILVYSKSDALTVPLQAVQRDGAGYVVTVREKGTGKLKKTKVVTGITTLDSVEILKGLKAGDEIVIEH